MLRFLVILGCAVIFSAFMIGGMLCSAQAMCGLDSGCDHTNLLPLSLTASVASVWVVGLVVAVLYAMGMFAKLRR